MCYCLNHCTPVLMSKNKVLLFSCLNLCTLVQKAGAKVRFFAHTAKQNAQNRPKRAHFGRFVQ